MLPGSLPEPFGGFELLSFLGLGPSASAWMAESPSYPDPPALKFLDGYPELDRADVRERFLQEADASRRVGDSRFLLPTLRVLDLHKHRADGWPPVALVSWLQGPSLQRVLEGLRADGHRLPGAVAVALLRDLRRGLRELHGAYGLVHRDVKPSNVVLRLRGERPYHGPASPCGARALLADFTPSCGAGLRPVLSGVRPRAADAPAAEETTDLLGAPASADQDWRGFPGVVAAVFDVADDEFRARVGRRPREEDAETTAEAWCARLFPQEAVGPTWVGPPQEVPSEERVVWPHANPPSAHGTGREGPGAVGEEGRTTNEVPGYEIVQQVGRGPLTTATRSAP